MFFYPHINYQGYQQASSDRSILPTQDRTWDFTVSSQPQYSQLESSGCCYQLLPRHISSWLLSKINFYIMKIILFYIYINICVLKLPDYDYGIIYFCVIFIHLGSRIYIYIYIYFLHKCWFDSQNCNCWGNLVKGA